MSATMIVAFGASFVMPIPAFELTMHRPGVLTSPLMKGNGDALFDIDHAIDERGWLSELKDEIQMQKDYLNQCFEAEECHLEHAQALEDNFSKDLLLRAAKEVSLSEQNACHSHGECLTHMRVPCTASCMQRREEAGEIEQFLQTLREQRRAAVAMLWDDRRLGPPAVGA